MTDKLEDLLNVKKSTGGRPCSFRLFLDTLPPDDQAAVKAAVYNEAVSTRHIWKILRDHRGATFSSSVIVHHRSEMCRSCSKNS